MLPEPLRRGLNRTSQRTDAVLALNFLERFVSGQRVTSLLRKKGLGGPHLVETW